MFSSAQVTTALWTDSQRISFTLGLNDRQCCQNMCIWNIFSQHTTFFLYLIYMCVRIYTVYVCIHINIYMLIHFSV